MSLLDALLLDPAPFEVWIAIRSDGLKGSGTASDPYDGSTAAKFDARMGELPTNTRVHLGPGTFQTSGYQVGSSTGWQLKTGLKILGSGMEVTKLQLTGHSASNYFYVAGHDLSAGATADFCEISELTVDCALGSAGTTTACGGVRLMGNHSRIHRVRVINWGSRDTSKPISALLSISALPDSGVPEIANCGIDSCVVVSPTPMPSVNALNVRSLIVRNNFYKNVAAGPYWNMGGVSAAVAGNGISYASGTGIVTVTTAKNHNLWLGARVKIEFAPNAACEGYREISAADGPYTRTLDSSSANIPSAARPPFFDPLDSGSAERLFAC